MDAVLRFSDVEDSEDELFVVKRVAPAFPGHSGPADMTALGGGTSHVATSDGRVFARPRNTFSTPGGGFGGGGGGGGGSLLAASNVSTIGGMPSTIRPRRSRSGKYRGGGGTVVRLRKEVFCCCCCCWWWWWWCLYVVCLF